jgi:carnitine 3-dehydrogenase
VTSSEIRHVAVIGTGTIGASWAAFFLSRGLAVAASDPAPAAEDFVRRFVAAAWPALVSLGGVETIPEHRLSFHAQPEEAVAEAEFVQENAPRARDAQTAATAPDRCCPAAIGHHRIELFGPADERSAKRLPLSERCVIGHPFNPPHLVPLVEVVAGAQTAPEAVERALTIYAALGKRPITSDARSRGTSPTGCRRHYGGRQSISSPRASPMSPTSTLRSARDRACVGR